MNAVLPARKGRVVNEVLKVLLVFKARPERKAQRATKDFKDLKAIPEFAVLKENKVPLARRAIKVTRDFKD